jgi:hypothetical protein
VPYSAVGMHSALESSIGLPSRSTSASRMLVFVTPPDVRRSFKLPPECDYEEHAEAAREGARGFSRERIRAFLAHLFRRGEQTEMSVPP